jgi:hypothetical protein
MGAGNWVVTTTGTTAGATLYSSYTAPMVFTGGYAASPAPRPKTALEWLDDEIQAVCKLARGSR